MPLLYRRMAITAKIETTYGTDSVPTGAANAMLVRNVRVSPLTVESEARELMRPYLGNSEDIVGAFYGGLQFDVECAGAGGAGTVPKYGPLLRGCGMAEVIAAGVSVTYTPISTAFESLSMYFYLDGVLHRFTGARGSVAARLNNRQAAMFQFNYQGLFQPVSDSAVPAAVYTGFQVPLAMNTANTPTFNLYGVAGSAAPLRNLSLDLANQVSYRNLVGSEAVQILDRKPAGQIEFEATTVAVRNWWNNVRDAFSGALQIVHGTQPGNIVEFTAPRVQLTGPNYGDFEGGAMFQAGLKLNPNAGNDELAIIVR